MFVCCIPSRSPALTMALGALPEWLRGIGKVVLFFVSQKAEEVARENCVC